MAGNRFIVVLALSLAVLGAAATRALAAGLRWSAPVFADTDVPRTQLSIGITGMSCPSTSLCVGVDGDGIVLSSTHPASGRPWRLVHLNAPVLTAISCPTAKMCIAGDPVGDIWASASPTGGAAGWRRSVVDPTGDGFTAVSCASTTLCVAVDDTAGEAFVSTHPMAGATAWKRTVLEPFDTNLHNPADGVAINAISCPTASLCVAVDSAGQVLTSTDPAALPATWSRDLLDPHALTGVSCQPGGSCVAVGVDGSVFRSTDPSSSSSWSRSMHAGDSFGPVDCPSASTCVTGDPFGGGVSTLSSVADAGTVTTVQRNGASPKQAISCPSPTLCVAGDGSGNVSIGEPEPPARQVPVFEVARGAPARLVAPARSDGSVFSVDSGVELACPEHRPICRVTGHAVHLFTTAVAQVAQIDVSVPAGQRRLLRFQLDRASSRTVRRRRPLNGVNVTFVARQGRERAVDEDFLLGIARPGARRPR